LRQFLASRDRRNHMTEEQKDIPKSSSAKLTEGKMVAVLPVEGWEVPFDASLVRFHEAAHAVYADHIGIPVGRLWAGDRARPHGACEDALGGCGYRRWPVARRPEDHLRFACLQIVGPYAAWRKAKGETMPRVPFEVFVAAAVAWPDRDIGRALDYLRQSVDGGGILEGAYEAMCHEIARRVEVSWLEIAAVADRLEERGCLRNWEVHRPMWETRGVSEPPTDRPFGDLLAQWDKDEVDRWISPGGWLWELIGPEQVGYGFDEPEDEEV
jgi:hypothetical protein